MTTQCKEVAWLKQVLCHVHMTVLTRENIDIVRNSFEDYQGLNE